MEIKIHPCPFCGSGKVRIQPIVAPGGICVHCTNCGAYGPDSESRYEAELKWNKAYVESIPAAKYTPEHIELMEDVCGEAEIVSNLLREYGDDIASYLAGDDDESPGKRLRDSIAELQAYRKEHARD